ncbi:MFS transporter [Shewanella sp. 202IG2-18]|uniref:MFS transporter n=1 Tax=Parashewanella hymeniacidonis TaxID=2807618 RepID=UPI00195F4D3E|nr:MFS transporter [Parashewanella hymeniacidonis]MBM7072160.1 MFS transporter [Parashewanella hymeniacidonis]
MRKLRLIAILISLVILSPLAIDIFLPALPTMVTALEVSNTHMQWTISIFIFSLGIDQLIIEPISDQYGRRPVVLFGILLYGISWEQ